VDEEEKILDDDENFSVDVDNEYATEMNDNITSDRMDDKNVESDYDPEMSDKLTSDRMDNKNFEVWDDIPMEDISLDVNCELDQNVQGENELKIIGQSDIDKKSKFAVLAHWMIIFISLWTTSFNITGIALDCIIHFIHAFFKICGQSIPGFNLFVSLFPTSLHNLYKLQGSKADAFLKYVVCSMCHSIYKMEDCVIKEHGKSSSKLCSFVEFPNHPQARHRHQCGNQLMKEILTKLGSTIFYPKKVYCYNSVIQTLKSFLSRPGFVDM
jgi:hypothetical protein